MSIDKDIVISRNVVCNGGGVGIGHPQVYLHISDKGMVQCPYCEKIFVYDENAAINGPASIARRHSTNNN